MESRCEEGVSHNWYGESRMDLISPSAHGKQVHLKLYCDRARGGVLIFTGFTFALLKRDCFDNKSRLPEFPVLLFIQENYKGTY